MKKHVLHYFFIFIFLIMLSRIDVLAFTPRYDNPGVQGTYYLNDNPYPYKGQNGTWYAFGRAYEILGYRPNIRNGNANAWWNNNLNSGAYPYGQTPKLGAIACWNSGTYGHVAIVEDIVNNKIVISESNYDPAVTFRTREIDPYSIAGFQGYIYLTNEVPNIDVFASSPEIQDGEYIINCQLSPNMAIQTDRNNRDNGANVSIGNTNSSDYQIWKFQRNSDDTFRIISKFNNKALDVEGKKTQSEANIQTWDYVDGDNQKWYVIHTGGGWYQFIAKHSGKLMDVSGGYSNEGTNIWQYETNGSMAQFFKLTKVEPQNNQPQPPPSKPKPQPQPSVPVQPQSTLSKPQPKPQPTPSNPANSKIVNRYYKRGEYNEGMYEGEWKNESPNGFGRLTYDDFADGMFYSCQNSVGQEGKALYYEGHFINGWRNGVGVVVYEHGCKEIGRFFGNWAAGKKVFEGRFYDENGNYFEGYLQATSAASANWHAAKVNGIDFSNPFSKKSTNSNQNIKTNNNAYSKPTSSAPEIQDGDYVIRTQVYDNMAIQSEMENDDNGSNVSIGIYKGYSNQKWHLQKNSDGTFKVICKSNDKALDVQDKGTQSRANIQTWDYVDGDNQKWYIVNAGDGWYQFVAKHSGHLMDVSGGVAENGTNIWQYEYNGSSAQKFKLEHLSSKKVKINNHEVYTLEEIFNKNPKSNEFNRNLAILSAVLCEAGNSIHGNDLCNAYRILGFNEKNIRLFSYPGHPKNKSDIPKYNDISLAFAIAHKKINSEYIISMTLRGTQFPKQNKLLDLTEITKIDEVWKDFSGQLSIGKTFGDTLAYDGFFDFYEDVKTAYEEYLKEHPEIKKIPSKNIKFLITGHSLGAAGANLLGAYYSNLNDFNKENIYVYTFATPYNHRKLPIISSNIFQAKFTTQKGDNIFNILNLNDNIVYKPNFPFSDWRRFGRDCKFSNGNKTDTLINENHYIENYINYIKNPDNLINVK